MCLRDGRQLSDSIVSLSTSPHSTAHPATGFLFSLPTTLSIPPSTQAPSQEGGFGGQNGGFIVGLQGALVLEDEDQGSRPSPRPKTLFWLASRSTKGLSWLGTTSGREGRWRLEVSVAVMAMARLRPSLRMSTMEKVYSKAAHTSAHTYTLPLFLFMHVAHQRQKSMNKYMSSVELHRSDKKKEHMNYRS